MTRHGFTTDGVDLSPAMIALAHGHHPEAQLFHADICVWEPIATRSAKKLYSCCVRGRADRTDQHSGR